MQKEIIFKDYKETYQTLNFKEADKTKIGDAIDKLIFQNNKIIRLFLFGNKKDSKVYSFFCEKYPSVVVYNTKACAGASVCIHSVSGSIKKFRQVEKNGKILGATFTTSNGAYFYFTGLQMGRSYSGFFKTEAQTLYRSIEKILKIKNLKPEEVFRYWIYLGDIYKNYASFNQVRTAYFKKSKIKDYPASTGIGVLSQKEEPNLNISFEAVKNIAEDVKISKVDSSLQNNPWEYGSKFSRVKTIIFEKDRVQKTYISGTSSIDKKGRSAFLHNPSKNVGYVMDCVEHLLQKNKMGFNEIVFSAVYFKNQKHFNIFRKIYLKNKWKFPYLVLSADICREDLFFEVECLAAKKI